MAKPHSTHTTGTMTIGEAADLLNTSRGFVLGLTHTGDLPHTIVGDDYLLDAAEVERYARHMHSERQDALQQLADHVSYTRSDF